ncbi:MAG TPA: bifunctional adenosylcobinamide kinase/adenosylcobinamide-phosphate guanylyltransferase [Streptosporangiaceae bacterium]|nr:bifunctional adenosylcobinamide kinase/adenosylcobinamide-phosphate guanylyltransferase [Streptosporangiaceae bacterium]
MDALVIGTGGARGWPEEGCRCASCMRARSAGVRRAPGRVLIADWLEVIPGKPLRPGTGRNPPAALHVERLAGGLDITGPDGGRLLLADGPGALPVPTPAARPYDIALLDLLASPVQLGQLRMRGLVHERTVVAALYTDDRITSEDEMARRCAVWGADHTRDGQVITGPAAVTQASPPRPHRTLIIGGARSGKSTEAELRLAAEPRVTYLAAGPFAPTRPDSATRGPDHGLDLPGKSDDHSWTGLDGEPDAEWARRVAIHRARRPEWWRTVESLDVAGMLRAETGALLVDGIGTWLAAVLDQAGMWADERPDERSEAGPGRPDPLTLVQAAIDELVDAWRQTSALVVAVTDQVGSGLVPAHPAGRVFRDQLGWLNQRLAAESELNLQVIAGRVTALPG